MTSRSGSGDAMPPARQRHSTAEHSGTSNQISVTRAPWAAPSATVQPADAFQPTGTPSSAPLNPESLQAQERAPWAGSASTDNGCPDGSGSVSNSSCSDDLPRPLPQAPTRAPWADGKLGSAASSGAHAGVPTSGAYLAPVAAYGVCVAGRASEDALCLIIW